MKAQLTTSEVNTLIASLLICGARYTTLGDKKEAEKYQQLENKLRSMCYDGEKIAITTIQTQFYKHPTVK